jgi:hypothetical protein
MAGHLPACDLRGLHDLSVCVMKYGAPFAVCEGGAILP